MIKVVYIAGSGRSGSTLLEQILNQVESFTAVGELRHLWRANYETDLCGCGAPLQACPFWRPIMTELFGSAGAVDFAKMLALRNQVDRIRYLPHILGWRQTEGQRRRQNEYAAVIEQIYRQIQTQQNTAYVIDSSKDVSTLYMLAKLTAVELHVLHMVRDSRAVAYSWQRKRVKPQVVGRTAYMPTYSPLYAGYDWLYRNLLVEAGKRLFNSYQLIWYEDLVTNPTPMLAKICAAIGAADADLGFVDQSGVTVNWPAHTVSGNPMRFHDGRLTLKIDLAWRQKMDRKAKWLVTALTWPLLKRYNYPIRV